MTVVHTLRCTGATGLADLADAAGLSPDDAESALIDAALAGLVTYERGEFGGWRLTAEGKAADDVAVAAELAATGARPAVERTFTGFLELNPELLDLCTAWQLGTADRARVLERFADLHARCVVVLEPAAGALPRFDRHRTGLTAALARARGGDTAYLTDRVDSYHTRWFRLHEDLLVTLGIPRY